MFNHLDVFVNYSKMRMLWTRNPHLLPRGDFMCIPFARLWLPLTPVLMGGFQSWDAMLMNVFHHWSVHLYSLVLTDRMSHDNTFLLTTKTECHRVDFARTCHDSLLLRSWLQRICMEQNGVFVIYFEVTNYLTWITLHDSLISTEGLWLQYSLFYQWNRLTYITSCYQPGNSIPNLKLSCQMHWLDDGLIFWQSACSVDFLDLI